MKNLLVYCIVVFIPLSLFAQNQSWPERFDKDKDGIITKNEWKGSETAFSNFDQNEDGTVSKDEIDSYRRKWRKNKGKGEKSRKGIAGKDSRNLSNAKFVHEEDEKRKLPPNTRYETCHSKLMNADIGYVLYVPDEYKYDGKPFPILFFFHGKTGNEIGASRNSKYLHQAIKEKVIRPSLAVYINGLHTSFYVDSYDKKYMVESFVIRELIPHLEKQYNIIKSREGRMLEGFSMGGHAAIRFALKYPDMFCSAVVYGPALLPLRAFKQIQPDEFRILFNSDDDLYRKVCPYDILDDCAAKVLQYKVRFKLFGGTEDPSNMAAVRFSAALREKGVYAEYAKVEGARHSMDSYFPLVGTAGYKFHEESMRAAGIDRLGGRPDRQTAPPEAAATKRQSVGGEISPADAEAEGLSPAGVYYCGPAGGFAPERARYESIPEVKLPFVNGLSFRQFWRNLEPEEGKYDWTPLENAYRLTKENRKWLMITVTAGMGTPDWVYEKGTKFVAFDGKQIRWLKRDIALKMPVPWDEIYLKEWEDFLMALGEKIAEWDNVYCVHMTGGGYISEMHLPVWQEGMIDKWENAGFSPEVGAAMWKRIIEMYDRHMPKNVGLVISLSPIVKGGKGGDGVSRIVFDWATKKYGNRVWYQRDILKERTATNPNGKLSSQMKAAASFTTIGWQTAFIPDKDLVGNKAIAYQHAINTNSSYVEVYPEEMRDASAREELMKLNNGLKGNYERLKNVYLQQSYLRRSSKD